MAQLTFIEVDTVDEACAALADDPWDAKIISGGTALVLMMRQGLIAPTRLISLGKLDALRGVKVDGDTLVLGACTSLTDVAADPQVRERTPSLSYACHRVGNVRVRNMATIGGNVAEADYASDPPAVLVALGAECVIQGPDGERRALVRDVITGFYSTTLGDGEIITAIRVPTGMQHSTYLKYTTRSSEDRPCVGVAAAASFDGESVTDLAVAVGATAETPQRLDDVLAPAVGTTLDADTRADIARGYAAGIEPLDDARGSAWYRTRMIEVFVRRALDDVVAKRDLARQGDAR